MNPCNYQNQNTNGINNFAYFHPLQHYQLYLHPQYSQYLQYYFQRHLNPYVNEEFQSNKPQIEAITIYSDDEQPIVKPKEQIQKVTPVLQINKGQQKLLNLDQLQLQGKLYDNESSDSPLLQNKVQKCLKYQKSKIQNKNENLQSLKLKKKILKPQRQPKSSNLSIIKQIQIGKYRQQYKFNQSSVKTQLIKVYTKNEDELQKLRELLLINFPNSSDEDAVKLLNVTGKSYEKAIDLIKKNELLVQYILETNKNNEYLEDDDKTTK
ncbi:unnamed protein product (macronuclear) [Paramecium tetraurelia]|uniref:CUE domain-containing protein n=1 Tax=Paramecium tetraurelia TaxID=5888 RepID=A0DG44_PARTE|nr:uncharacterized protein GSPATT00002139001 [Paramecium tetraurelia]CAK82011.1 unnamed protein product [Paramecium tetraurelia]|eukprot:XP_001449408.1 hypothetical protein (macronuclear) [Paramecium tetraurelia strain d4-2]